VSEFQPSLFDAAIEPAFDASYSRVERIALDDQSWLDFAPGWVSGADRLFEEVVRVRTWGQRTRWMYQGRVVEPRLTSPWFLDSGEPLVPPLIEAMRQSLSQRYRVTFDSVGFNYYRDGNDSVAWHSDKIRPDIEQPVVVLVSLGEPRKFMLRPKGGGRSRSFMLGRGDLLVTGGRAQRDHEHTVPKTARAGPRISLAFRHGLDPKAYGT
jgi:alkylated DNA repair dioxygenase AlkB